MADEQQGSFLWSVIDKVWNRQSIPKGLRARDYNKYGWRPDHLDHRDKILTFALPESSSTDRVDLRPQDPAQIFYQGKLGSCTANAIAAAFEFDQHKEEGCWEFTPSRLFIYYNERVCEGTVNEDTGASLRDGIKAVSKVGCCPEEMWPYDESRYAEEPPVECFEVAAKNRATAYHRLDQDLHQLKSCIREGFPFLFGFMVLSSFEHPTVARTGFMKMPQKGDKPMGGHAVCAVGFDDDQEVFICRNSWGSGWGDDGYFYMPYRYISHPQLANDFWTIRWV